MGTIDCPETSAKNYHYLLRNNPEERGSQLLLSGSLKSRNFIVLFTIIEQLFSVT
jgi:hypothetical protein